MPLSATKLVNFGWLTLLALLGLFIFLDLLRFLVFLLFMYLVIDLLVHGLGKRIPFVSRKAILYTVYTLVAGFIVFLALVVAPRFVTELPAYMQTLFTRWGLTMQFPELKLRALEWGRNHIDATFDLAKRAGTNVVLLIFAFVITFLVTHDRLRRDNSETPGTPQDDLWHFLADFLDQKISAFYGYFRQVMAAQVVISLINAILTLGLLLVLGIPHKIALVVMVFVFGLLPIVGNLISNTLICISALLWAGFVQLVAALVFLVVIHKLEYFLNGKIIGNFVKLPMYITLLGLIIGESLFHISGMILSIPVILFVRAELSAIKTNIGTSPTRT
jgi:predicted PurR-regulated permease PerM